MDITHITSLLGGVALFLYGMSIMGAGLEKLAGGKMQGVLQKLTSSTIKGGVSTRFILQESYFFYTFRNIFPGGKQKDFRYFTYILHSAFPDAICRRLPGQLFHGLAHCIGRKQEHTTAGVYLHMIAHITQLKILHGVSLLCFCFVPGLSR